DNDGDFDIEDDACGDLPNLGMTKDFVSATRNLDGTYTVRYNVIVTNTGGATGEYDLQDTPSFDDDVTINSGSFSGQNSGGLIDGVNTLATDEAIAPGAVHVYTLIFNVTLDLSGDANDNDGGDNQYVACGESSDNGDITPGEGLYNLAELDSDNDGDFDIEDDACGDLPNITLDKGLIGVTDNGDGTFGVSYQILVTNNGGAAGTYGLVDVPAFDDDVIILGGGFLIEQGGTPLSGAFTGDPTPLTLATNQSIDAGATHTYTIDFVAELDLSEDSTDGGDNEYTACADPSGGDGSNPGEGLYNRAELDLNNDGTPDLVDDVCGDVPTADLSLVKVVDNNMPDVGDIVTFTITVTNEGPQNATNVEVEDVVPNGYNNIGNISNGGSAVDNVITWTGINLAVGQEQSVTFTATVQAPGADVDYVNVAEITDADQYDNDSTPDNGADTNGTGGIGSEDPDGTQDPNDEDDGDDAGVMPPCMLNVEFAPTDCQDNGTSTNPNDDFFEVIAQVTGMNASGSWTATDSRGNNYSGAYGVDFVFGPYSISGSEGDEIIITITDSEDGACSTFISATTPEETCSTDCVITVTEPQTVECIGGETNTPDDDAFIFTVNVNGVNVGDQGWRAEDQYGNVYFGEYGFSPNTFVDFGPYSYTAYGGTSIILTVTDVENPDCGQGTLVLNVPNESCSQDCSINLDVEYIVCDDNGTEWDPSDDVFYAWVNITGDNASFQGWTTDDEGRADGDNTGYYGLHEFGPYPISAGNHSLTIMDRVTDDCEATITLEAPGTCSDGCRLDVTQQTPVCDNLGTADPSDDVYYVTVSVQPLGNFSNTGWRISMGNGVFLPGGPYGAQVVLGPYLISDGPRTINIVDNAYISCRTTIEVIPPDECSDPDPCSMVAGEFFQGPCNDNGTGDTPADDFYELDYSAPVVTNPAGTQYQLLLDGVVVATNDYGMGGSINVPADGEIHILTWQDATNANCATSATLPAVEPCSEPECSMLVGTFTQGECNDNNTDETGADDFYALTYSAPNVSNPVGTQYQLLLDGAVVATNNYGTGGTINVPADGLTHTLTWQDATDPTCAAGTTLPAVGPCSELPCDISTNVTFVYNDNGTPLDHTDDTFDLVIIATNSGASSGFWTITNMMGMNQTYPYNQTVTITGIDANSDFAATIADSEDETCSVLIRNNGQAVVGNFVWIDEDCDGIQDDGELGLAGVTVTITGTDMNGNPVTATTVTDENGAYLFTNLPSGFDYKVTFSEPDGYDYAPANEGGNDELDSDAGANGMTTTFMLMSSSVDLTIDAGYCAEPEPCNIQPGNLTFGDCEANEDLFQYPVTFTSPAITNGCGEYQVLLDGVVFYTGTTGDAGGTIMVPADNANHTITFRDACNADCARSVVLAPVAPCEVACVIEPGTITQIGDCNDNGTADDSTDDFYTLTFTAPTSQDGTTNYEVLLDGVVVYTGTFGDAGSTINVPADG
ncbi:MAG: SdrD B-like domain-containing protein, partial [Lewinella sp.]|uniref:SdrD B-like domain-containing protein n=1 Tax=Lewinella sp. TaxID=2004506 RepID=UPI003D6B69B0